jgi:hypothetical protein
LDNIDNHKHCEKCGQCIDCEYCSCPKMGTIWMDNRKLFDKFAELDDIAEDGVYTVPMPTHVNREEVIRQTDSAISNMKANGKLDIK